ncbi:SRPBCC family protein [bacterium]|nr:SRPBCC family protein [bacterium]
MIVRILLGLVVVIALFCTYIALESPDYTIVRETTIAATPEKLFPYINNSKLANDWMPWLESDPKTKMTYEGPAEGVGSIAKWDSPGPMGTGSATVIDSLPNEKVVTQLLNKAPMEMSQVAEITLTPGKDGTLVRWSVKGQNNFVGRAVCFFMNMDKMVGGEFEKGLAKLKVMAEEKAPSSS